MKGVIYCEGKDSRLNPITYTIPKELIPIGNKPLLVYTIESLLKSGVKELGILVDKFNKPIFESVLTYYFKEDFHYIIQEGRGHGLLFAESFVKEEKFIFLIGDNFFNFNLETFIKDFKAEDVNCKILLKKVDEPENFQVAYIGDEGIIDLEDKPKMAFSNWAVTGLYAFDKNIFEALKEDQLKITQAIKWLLQKGYRVDYEELRGKWREIGNPSHVIEQNIDILSAIEEDIRGEIINSQTSGKIILGNGSVIYNSTVRGPVVVGENTTIKNSYIGPYTSIGNGVNIDKSNLENSIILDGCNIWGLEEPVDSSIIGEGSVVRGVKGLRKNHKFIVGRNSKIYLSL